LPKLALPSVQEAILTALFLVLLGAVLGALAGIGWYQARTNARLRSILEVLDYRQPENVSLPVDSQLRRKAAQLQQEREYLKSQLEAWQSVLQNAPIGYLQLDEDNQILWCNDRAQETLHMENWQRGQQRLLLETVRSYELDELIQKTRRNRQNQILEWQFYPSHADSTFVDQAGTALKAWTVSLFDKNVGIFLENRQPLLDLSQQRTRWASDLAHELRTPLTSIRLVAETLENKVPETSAHWILRMLDEIDRLTRLVQDFLDLNNLEESPSQNITLKPINLSEIVGTAWQSLEPYASQKQIELLQTGDLDVKAIADPNRLTQVFINLLDNAIKFSPQPAEINVNIRNDPDRICLEIIDQGQGFAAKDLPHVFERLYRGDVSRQQSNDDDSFSTSNGLGLAIVKQIILAHRGTVTASNRSGGGGQITIYLPPQSLTNLRRSA
jgi:two-component system, OmpR family, phosphate regulon sensor histidine kinase PhoR